MPDRTGGCLETLRRKLQMFEEELKDLRRKIDSEDTWSRIDRDIEDAEAALKRIADDALAAQARMQIEDQARALITSGEVMAWKRDGELERLRQRAEAAEAYAAWSLIVATQSIHSAELATLKAIAARVDLRILTEG